MCRKRARSTTSLWILNPSADGRARTKGRRTRRRPSARSQKGDTASISHEELGDEEREDDLPLSPSNARTAARHRRRVDTDAARLRHRRQPRDGAHAVAWRSGRYFGAVYPPRRGGRLVPPDAGRAVRLPPQQPEEGARARADCHTVRVARHLPPPSNLRLLLRNVATPGSMPKPRTTMRGSRAAGRCSRIYTCRCHGGRGDGRQHQCPGACRE
ncbi:hypothetical protein AURDEDRAFT_145920 [Auricularia subglabra TFB-10046 SS5]|nr:hypothetical protein AURDEDRAFT_145920 [Auricularia subglabra TFB-10046 SS5]